MLQRQSVLDSINELCASNYHQAAVKDRRMSVGSQQQQASGRKAAGINNNKKVGKIRRGKKTTQPIIVKNRFLLYALTAFIWIFRKLMRYLSPAFTPLSAYAASGASVSANLRRQNAAAKIAALKDKMSSSSSSTTENTDSTKSQRDAKSEGGAQPCAHPCRSVTLKAHVTDKNAMEAAIFEVMDTIGHVTKQEDIFFNVPYGQMKLRISQAAGKDNGELISYKQTNNMGPNFSESRVTQVTDVPYLRTTLALSLSELGKISKERRTYERDNVRICLDDVTDLGCFVDIDIKCDGNKKRTADELLKQIENIKNILNLQDDQLVPYSYFELLQLKNKPEQQKRNSNDNEKNGVESNKKDNNKGNNTDANVGRYEENASGVWNAITAACDDGESGISEGGSYVGGS